MSRFIDNKDGTVTDTLTRLMWQQSKGERFTFEDAQEYAASLMLAGYNNWRLPTIEELRSLINRDKNDPAIDPVFECRPDYYWSGTTAVHNSSYAWYVLFYVGCDDWFSKGYVNYVRYVRDIKEED